MTTISLMPELPEVETTCRGIAPYLIDQIIDEIIVRERRMRWPIEDDIFELRGQKITAVGRRAKYILIHCGSGTLILHLGMSGSTRICSPQDEIKKHEHLILIFGNHLELRLHDPRRFGAVLWHPASHGSVDSHPRLKNLGPEPLADDFCVDRFTAGCQGKSTTIKQHIMNNKIVVGVGNIYASEALFRSKIHPKRAAGRISPPRLASLHKNIREVLSDAIQQGGTTLRDFKNQEGEPGYFQQNLDVYGRENQPCQLCSTPIKRTVLSNRATFFCPSCQR